MGRLKVKAIAFKNMSKYTNQHYIPQWYQKNFIPDNKGAYWRLDLKPDRITHPDGREEIKDISLESVKNCFAEDFFYKNLLFTDPNFLEKSFYGSIDDKGAKGIQTLFSPFGKGSGERFLDFLDFMDTLRLRTPKGIELVKKHRFIHQTGRIELKDIILDNIRLVIGMHQTMWIEGVWFYLSAEKSSTKFIVSDHPLVLFNRKINPQNESLDMFMLLGTILIFPLDLNNCLVIFHRDYGISRELNPVQRRINVRAYRDNPFFVPEKLKSSNDPMGADTKELNNEEVLAVNCLIKERAHRFIASYNKDDLFPEKVLKEAAIANIEDIILPKAHMIVKAGNSYYGTTTGKCFGVDPYGRHLDPVESEREFKEILEESKRIMKNRQK